jgi:polysaccharide biosynthesis/export protein
VRVAVTAGALLLLAACAGRPDGPAEPGVYMPAATPTTAGTLAPAPAAYRINPSDELRVSVYGEPELTLEELPVDTNGDINVPLAGTVKAQGHTADELAGEIGSRLRRYLRRPQVSVNVTKFTSQRITVGGYVERGGVFERIGQTTLIDAVSLAGGLSEVAREDDVLVLRRGADGSRQVARFDLRQIRAGQMADPVLQPGDAVVVGASNARRVLGYAIGLVPAAAGVFITLINGL